MTKKQKIERFLGRSNKTYSCKGVAGMLKIKPETARRYLRTLWAEARIDRFREGKMHRYFV